MADGNEPAATEGDLGEAGKRAIASERAARKAAEDKVKSLETEVAAARAAADESKSELEKLGEKVDKLTTDLSDERLDKVRLEVATDAKLTQAQAAYLKGATREELAASAAELAETFGIKPDPGKGEGDEDADNNGGQQQQNQGGATPPTRRPTEALTGGGAPTTSAPDETDPRKLADAVPRR